MMQTVIRAVVPQPVLADPKAPGRWIWGPTEPITDMCHGGSSPLSWWNDHDEVDFSDYQHDYCPIERPRKSKCVMRFDGERWLWHVSFTEAAAKKMNKGAER